MIGLCNHEGWTNHLQEDLPATAGTIARLIVPRIHCSIYA